MQKSVLQKIWFESLRMVKKYIKFHSEGPMFESSRDIHIKDHIIVYIRDVNDEFFDCVLK